MTLDEEGDSHQAIPAGAVIYTQGYEARPDGPKIIIAIAATGATKLNVVTDMERW